MAWMTKQTNKQTPHVDVMIAWLIRCVLVNFSTHNSRRDRSKGDLGADFAEPRWDPQVKGSVTGNKREAWGAWFHSNGTRSREIPRCDSNVDLRFQTSPTESYADSRVSHFKTLVALSVTRRAASPAVMFSVWSFGKWHRVPSTVFLAQRESVARRLGARSCPLPSSKGSCVLTELWSPS